MDHTWVPEDVCSAVIEQICDAIKQREKPFPTSSSRNFVSCEQNTAMINTVLEIFNLRQGWVSFLTWKQVPHQLVIMIHP